MSPCLSNSTLPCTHASYQGWLYILWSHDYSNLQNNVYIPAKKYVYIKLTYCEHPNKNNEHPDLRIIKNWVQQN